MKNLLNTMIEEMTKQNLIMVEAMGGMEDKIARSMKYNYTKSIYMMEGTIQIDGEYGHDTCDYYGDFRGGYSWINPTLERLAKEAGFMIEWENPACCRLYKL